MTDIKQFVDRYINIWNEPDAAARRQFNPGLAAKAGSVPDFARHTTGLDKLEEEAVALQRAEAQPKPRHYALAPE